MGMNIIKGKISTAKKIVLYGPEGIGKSTFASKFPDPVFIDTEGSTKDMDVARFDAPTSWEMLLAQVQYVRDNPNICKTLVVDTADWGQKLCVKAVCDKHGVKGIEDFGFGKGYVYVYEEFGKLLNALTEVLERNIHTFISCHAMMRKFEQPDEMGSYDRWELKLLNSPKCSIAAMVKEWADMVLFANYKTNVINVDPSSKQGKYKAQGGSRVMYTTHNPCWDAKNRYGLPDMMPFEYAGIAHIIEPATIQQQPMKEEDSKVQPPAKEDPRDQSAPAAQVKDTPKEKEEKISADTADMNNQDLPFTEPNIKIPKALRDLMIANKVDEWEIQNAVSSRGYFPSDMEIEDYPRDFIDGVLVGAWSQVFGMIKEARVTMEIPFK